jgi:hypothetical protein
MWQGKGGRVQKTNVSPMARPLSEKGKIGEGWGSLLSGWNSEISFLKNVIWL